MAIVQAMATSFKSEILSAVHAAADVYKIALYIASANLGAGTAVYTAVGEVAAGGGYAAGGMVLTGRAVVVDGVVAILDFDDAVWAAATITARGALIYNSSKGNKAVAILDFGTDKVSTAADFTVAMPPATATEGIVRIGG